MKKFTSHSRNSLFLMEMIISLLFLSLMCSACIQIFAQAYFARKEARNLNHMQELIITSGEILEGTDGSVEAFCRLLPDGIISENTITYYFDQNWEICIEKEADFVFSIELFKTDKKKTGTLLFQDSKENILKELKIQFPILQITEGLS